LSLRALGLAFGKRKDELREAISARKSDVGREIASSPSAPRNDRNDSNDGKDLTCLELPM
jgi:hypothetical protein